jgi:hypothetical protein
METRPFNQWKQAAGNAPVEGARSACFWMPLNGPRPVILNDPADGSSRRAFVHQYYCVGIVALGQYRSRCRGGQARKLKYSKQFYGIASEIPSKPDLSPGGEEETKVKRRGHACASCRRAL